MAKTSLNEQTASQLPALHLLGNLGCTYLPPTETSRLRGGRLRYPAPAGISKKEGKLAGSDHVVNCT